MNTAVALLSPDDIALPRYERMCKAISVCHRIDEVKLIQDKAAALKAYARQIHNREAEVQFAEIKVRAERRCGELMEDLKKSGVRASNGQTSKDKLKIKDFGLSQMDAHRMRQSAAVPERKFEAHLAQRRASGRPVSSLSVRSLVIEKAASSDHAERALKAIEAISDLSISPASFIKAIGKLDGARVVLAVSAAAPWMAEVSSYLGENRT